MEGNAESANASGHQDDDVKSTMSLISTSVGTFITAPTGEASPNTEQTLRRLQEQSAYAQLLKEKNLWPIDPLVEQDWSGRGQYAEFLPAESAILNELLDVEDTLGQTSSATIESVRCRRILLARKSVFCPRPMSKKEALEEVAHLTRLQHAHIVRVIGTYTWKKTLAILLYPVAEYNLTIFLSEIGNISFYLKDKRDFPLLASGLKFFACLSGGLAYIHSTLTRHMDIKPQNILVKETELQGQTTFKVYIADFGISRAYESNEAVVTDGPISFTRKYASPGVTRQESRGLPADVFSLGCVFLELFLGLYTATLNSKYPTYDENPEFWTFSSTIRHYVAKAGSYQAAIKDLRPAIQKGADLLKDELVLNAHNLGIINRMLCENAEERPTSKDLRNHFGLNPCCHAGPDKLEAAAPRPVVMDTFIDEVQHRRAINMVGPAVVIKRSRNSIRMH